MTTATLRNRIELLPATDLNKSFRMVIRYAWIGTGILFLCYSYFVGAITFSVIKQQALEQSTKGLISTMSNQERTYLQTQQSLTENYANTIGLVKSSAVTFATAKPVLAWNVGE